MNLSIKLAFSAVPTLLVLEKRILVQIVHLDIFLLLVHLSAPYVPWVAVIATITVLAFHVQLDLKWLISLVYNAEIKHLAMEVQALALLVQLVVKVVLEYHFVKNAKRGFS
jgi:hypothetical protein